MSRGRRRSVKALIVARLAARLPQRLRDLGRTPGAQHRRLGQDQRQADPEPEDPLGARRLPRRPALRERRPRKGIRRASCPAKPRSSPGRSPAACARSRRQRRRKGAGNARPRRTSGRTPTGAPTNSCVAVLEDKKEAVSHRRRQSQAAARQPGHQPRQPDRGSARHLAEKLPPDAGQVTILRSDQLKTAQNIAVALKGLAIVLSLLTFLAFGLAIYLSRDERWVTVLFCGDRPGRGRLRRDRRPRGRRRDRRRPAGRTRQRQAGGGSRPGRSRPR